MQAKYRISEEDYVNTMKLFAKLTRQQIFIYAALALVLIALAVFGSLVVKAGAIGGLAGGLIVTVLGRYIIAPIMARRHYRKYKAIHEEFTVELLQDGVRFISPNADGKLIWNHLVKWRQNDNYILIYPMPRLYHIVPKSVVSDGFDVSLLINRLTQHVGGPV
ncbi:YcxB family protein [Collimonas sp. H4R21]|uniref:YcxB family protein n=1 Tax=Collimonas rhizosphaerae TaxID=3126357 RepID=A0ABU9Q0V4_9BURK